MGKTWREIVVEARARGTFRARDRFLWLDVMTCPAAEAALGCGVSLKDRVIPINWRALWEIGHDFGDVMRTADFDGADILLDLIEDRALTLKREQP